MALIIFAVVVALIIDYIIAKEFADIAAGKGYHESKYFWYCFLLGIVGYLLVIALPDIRHKSQTKQPAIQQQANEKHSTEESAGTDRICPACGWKNVSYAERCTRCGQKL